MAEYKACRVESVGGRKGHVVSVAGHQVGLYFVEGAYVAVLNRCPHQAAPVCSGGVEGMTFSNGPNDYQLDSTPCVLRCPWHGWEFNLLDKGTSLFDPKVQLKMFPVREEDGYLFVTM
ncbi:Rieske (2Fe-2S) protein [Thalassoglobus sp.]|uniref:Rieske (2Fe-2S) protein n=1 Tax=Thalassoglobus sp. TaxID=2795869 RepID=UPI003AA7E0D2